MKNRHLIDGPIAEWVARHTTAEIVEALGGVVPVGPVNKPADLFETGHVPPGRCSSPSSSRAGGPSCR